MPTRPRLCDEPERLAGRPSGGQRRDVARITIRLDRTDHDRLAQAAESAGVSLAAYIRSAVEAEPLPINPTALEALDTASMRVRQLGGLLKHLHNQSHIPSPLDVLHDCRSALGAIEKSAARLRDRGASDA